MSVISLLEISIESINKYKKLIDNHNSSKEYGSDIVNAYNNIGDNIEALSEEISDIFNSDDRYNEHFENDCIQDSISEWLNRAFEDYDKLKNQKKCEEKVALAYEWLFEVMLFTSDDEEIKSKITLNSNGIILKSNKNPVTEKINSDSKVLVKVFSGGKTEDMYLKVEEVVDDYLYSYIGDMDNEEDLIIYPSTSVFKIK